MPHPRRPRSRHSWMRPRGRDCEHIDHCRRPRADQRGLLLRRRPLRGHARGGGDRWPGRLPADDRRRGGRRDERWRARLHHTHRMGPRRRHRLGRCVDPHGPPDTAQGRGRAGGVHEQPGPRLRCPQRDAGQRGWRASGRRAPHRARTHADRVCRQPRAVRHARALRRLPGNLDRARTRDRPQLLLRRDRQRGGWRTPGRHRAHGTRHSGNGHVCGDRPERVRPDRGAEGRRACAARRPRHHRLRRRRARLVHHARTVHGEPALRRDRRALRATRAAATAVSR